MTKTMLATATVDLGTGSTDVAVPAGTTVAGLLAMLRVDSADPGLTVTLPDGRPAALASAIGPDLPSGVRLSVAGGRTDGDARTRELLRSSTSRFADVGATAAGLLLAAGLGAGVASPLLTPAVGASQPVRLVVAVVGLVVLALAARRARLVEHPAWALVVPGVAGLLATAVIAPGSATSGSIGLLTGLVVATLVPVGSWLHTDSGAAGTAALCWGLAAVVAAAAVVLPLSAVQAGAVLLLLGVVAVALAPTLALRVPQSQLLDLPQLITSVAAVRAEEVPPPARITPRRVSATIAHAAAVTDTAAIGGTALAVAGGIVLASATRPGTMTGVATLVGLASAVLSLALVTRSNRSPAVRIAPRIGAATLAAATGVGLVAGSVVSSAAMAAALMVVAGAVLAGAVRLARPHPSAVLGRLADIVQALCLAVLPAATVLASGLFDQVWRWAS